MLSMVTNCKQVFRNEPLIFHATKEFGVNTKGNLRSNGTKASPVDCYNWCNQDPDCTDFGFNCYTNQCRLVSAPAFDKNDTEYISGSSGCLETPELY